MDANRFKVLLFFYTLGLVGCSSYKSDMNMNGRRGRRNVHPNVNISYNRVIEDYRQAGRIREYPLPDGEYSLNASVQAEHFNVLSQSAAGNAATSRGELNAHSEMAKRYSEAAKSSSKAADTADKARFRQQ